MQGTFEGFDDYERRKERARKQQAGQSRKGRDIGPLPEVANPEEVEACRYNLRLFLERYLAETFCLAWSQDHLDTIATLQRVVLEGGQFALAMPRANGKSSLVLGATLWAVAYGHRRFIVPIAATGPKAEGMLESIKASVESNELLLADFPAMCYPIRRLEGINNRAGGQILDSERTRIKWTGKRLVFPTVKGAASSGVIVHAAGLLGSIRGLQQMTPEGETVRPDLALADDPQTDESAKSPSQTARRLKVLRGAVLGLSGPNKRIAVIVPCTVIQPGDMADQLLDREKSPEYQGKRTKLLSIMPENMKLWERYKELRQDSFRAHGDGRDATEYYRVHLEEMNAGAVASWEARYEPGQLSAIQYAMDKWAQDEASFFAEFQNEPKQEEESGIETLKAAQLLERCNGRKRWEVPEWADRITAYADLQQDILPWVVIAWGKNLRGAVIAYGAFPDQAKRYYSLRDVSPTLREFTEQPTIEAAWEVGLDMLAEDLLGRELEGPNGPMQIGWMGVDANWAISKETVYKIARKHERLHPCHGKYVGASSLPMSQWKKKPGDRRGHFWRSTMDERTRVYEIDNNAWKSIIFKRCKGDPEGESALTWFGSKPYVHEMWCDELSAEYAVLVSARGRRVYEFKNRPGRDNHWFDCTVGAAVGASCDGIEVPGQAKPAGRKRRSLRQLLSEANK